MFSTFINTPSLMKKANEVRKTEQGLPQTKSSTLHAETKPPWHAVEEPAVCSDTSPALRYPHQEHAGTQTQLCGFCWNPQGSPPAVAGSEEQVSAGSYVNYG